MTEDGLPKLGDWGLATLVSEATSKMTGTLEYMAPEIYRGDTSYDERADTFSFGIVLYMITTGSSHPYGYTYYTPAQIAQAVAENGLRPPIPCSMDTNLANLIEKCWSDSQERRPPMREVASILNVLRKESLSPETAPHPGMATSGQKNQSWTSWFGF
jgi:serine/threonine protein kinase